MSGGGTRKGGRRLLAALAAGLLVAVAALSYVASQSGSGTDGYGSGKTELIVSAAASLKESLEALKTRFEDEHPDIRLTFNYGSSGALQKQIEQGAPADLFLSAGMQQIEALREQSLIEDSVTLLGNELVVVVPKDAGALQSITKLSDLTLDDYRVIAVGQPETVPAGQYAKEALVAAGIWNDVEDRLVFAKDVRQALTYAETGNADAALVYATDAAASSRSFVALRVDGSLHSPIAYPAALLAESAHPDEAAVFYRFLQSAEASELFAQFGFRPAA
ncbi:molybdate ABC transporter substrate-binding protein [Paenibacillus methanolicus]|uniref:Molybdate transport system substrate-binding protein n=1 Tax=Paenibacillus methanolicus TaxID=582686 RepID=A0A5S5CIA0_9BACL|nr:molybdate ABC transporter substrate-binding protein [Paenibacillus methanolicus]TYP79516.1 molybdate transport system substrate-binding protein [Paenibacillus methanolicus]